MNQLYKFHSGGNDVALLTCPEGSLINGKKGATKKKLLCKCGASGKCKWKNEKNKKINKLTYQKWKCVASETDSGNTDGGDAGGDDGAGQTDICPQEWYRRLYYSSPSLRVREKIVRGFNS